MEPEAGVAAVGKGAAAVVRVEVRVEEVREVEEKVVVAMVAATVAAAEVRAMQNLKMRALENVKPVKRLDRGSNPGP